MKRYTETYKGKRIDIRYSTQKELDSKLKRRKSLIDRDTIGADMKLSEFGRRYIDMYKKHAVSEEWCQRLYSYLDKRIVAVIGDKRLSRVSVMDVQGMLNCLDYSDGYIGKIYDLTSQIFHSAYINGLTETDISTLITKPKGRKAKKGTALTKAQQDAFLKAVEGHRGEVTLKIIYYCGLRPKEAMNLTSDDIDLDNKIIHIRGTKSHNADRYVPIPDSLLPTIKQAPDPPCIQDIQQLHRAWRNIKRLMNIEMGCTVYRNKLQPPYPVQEDLRVYDLRHTYCTNLELHGVPISIASRLMGHSDISLTAEWYTHETFESIEIARKLINEG